MREQQAPFALNSTRLTPGAVRRSALRRARRGRPMKRYLCAVQHIGRIAKRSVLAFYEDQGTHHAAALTYYALMSLFPTLLLAVSLLGILGEYPGTYNAIIGHLRDVVPAATLAPL